MDGFVQVSSSDLMLMSSVPSSPGKCNSVGRAREVVHV